MKKKKNLKKKLLLTVLAVGISINGFIMPTAFTSENIVYAGAYGNTPYLDDVSYSQLPMVPLDISGSLIDSSYLSSALQTRNQAINVDGKTYFFNAGSDGHLLTRFDTATGEYKKIGYPPFRNPGAALGKDGYIYVFGGTNYSYKQQDTIYRYDVKTNQFEYVGRMPIGLSEVDVVSHSNGKLYITGGRVEGGGVNYKLWSYTPGDTTTVAESDIMRFNENGLTEGSAYGAYYEGPDGSIYYIGGMIRYSGYDTNKIYKFNPTTKQWSMAGTLPMSNHLFGHFRVGNDIYMFAGTQVMYTNQPDVLLKYNLETETTELVGRLPYVRNYGYGFIGSDGLPYLSYRDNPTSKDHIYKVDIEALNTRITAQHNDTTKSIDLQWQYLKDGASSYELMKNNELLYSGNALEFNDPEVLGDTNYTYTLRVKDVNGEILNTRNVTVKTPNYTQLTATNVQSGVGLEWIYEKSSDVSFEVLRNDTSIYKGNASSFVDKDALGATDYDYTVKVKNGESVVIGTKSASIKTPIKNPVANISNKTDDSVTLSWGHNKNPENTEYFLSAEPKEDTGLAQLVSLNNNFDNLQDLAFTGNWAKNTAYKTSGTYSLKSAYISHRGSTSANTNVTLPANAKNGKITFKYKVSSESGYDNFKVFVNGTESLKASGETGWKSATLNLKTGVNDITFNYSKDGSVSKGSDASYIDDVVVTYESGNQQESGWIKGTSHTFSNLDPSLEYEFFITAKANGLTSERVKAEVQDNNQLQVATEAVNNLELLLQEGLDTQSMIDNANDEWVNVLDLVNALPDGESKTELLEKLTQLKSQIDIAQDIFDAKNAVSELENLVNGDLTTQDLIDNAQNQLDLSQTLVHTLPEGEIKSELQQKIDLAQKEIDLAQDILNAKNAVAELENLVSADLSTQSSIDSAQVQLDNALILVSKLPESELKNELLNKLNDAQNKILEAQAVLDVKTAEENKTQENVDKANESIDNLSDGALKDSLQERINIVQDIINANNILNTLLNSDFTTFEEIDNAIAELEKAIAIINTLPESDDKEALLVKVAEVKNYLADELINVLELNKKGKPYKLSEQSLDLLVQYAIQETGSTSIRDRGKVMSFVMKVANKHANGQEVNTLIEKYLN